MSNWGENIRRLREEKGLKQTELARACGVRPPSVSDWETGETKMIDGLNLLRVSAALEVDPETIMGIPLPPGRQSLAAREPSNQYGRAPEVNDFISLLDQAIRGGVISVEFVSGLASSVRSLIGMQPEAR